MQLNLCTIIAVFCVTVVTTNAQTIIIGAGGSVGVASSGNGNFESKTGAVPAANTSWPTSEMPNWHNLSGAETQTCGSNQGIAGSPEANSYGAYLFPSFVVGNDTGYTIQAAGETFDVSLYLSKFGAAGNYDGDEAAVVTLFASTTGVTDNTVLADTTTLGSTTFPVTGSWISNSATAFYTSTLADVGKTVYLGLTLANPTGSSVFPRIDVVKLVVNSSVVTNPPPVTTNSVSGTNGWQAFVNQYHLSGDKSADADGDGQPDYIEFLHGGNPTNAASLAASPFLIYSNGVAYYHTVETSSTNPGVPFTPENVTSLTAGAWTNVWDAQTNYPAALAGYNEVVRQRNVGTNVQRFFRVRPLNSVNRPNILLILADDLGYADVSFNVHGIPDIPTPNLDKLAKSGTIFTSAYVVHPFCGPSRMGLFSGRYPHEFGGPFNLPDWSTGDFQNQGITTNETLISTVLHNAGYFTGAMGKWHMGRLAEHHPNNRGFDEFWGFLGGGHNYFGPYSGTSEYGSPPEHNGTNITTLTASDYMTDVLSTQGMNFLNSAMTKTNPFFLYMAYNAPHMPNQAKQSDLDMFPNLTGNRKTKAAMVNALDRGVSNLVATLKANGQYDNTLIVFLSDNGGISADGSLNLPLQGNKGDVWEGGFRVPMFMHLPNVIPSGQTFDHPISAIDFYPTFAHLAGATIPPGKVIEGKDVWNDLILTRDARPGQPIYAVRYNVGYSTTGGTQVGIRQDQWKAMKTLGQNWKLYNITNDISETTDLSASYPMILSNLVAAGGIWATNHVTPLWYDDAQAGTDWTNRAMPHYDAIFSLP